MRAALVKFGDVVLELESAGAGAPEFEGGNRYVRDFMAATGGDERLLLSLWESGAVADREGAKARTVRMAPSRTAVGRGIAMATGLATVLRELLRFRPNVVVCMDTGPPAAACLTACALTGARLVLVATTDLSGSGAGRRVRSRLARSAARSRRTVAVLACAEGVRARLGEIAGDAVAGRTRVYHPDYRAFVGRLPSVDKHRAGSRDVLFVGRLAAVKGTAALPVLAESLARAGGRLVIAGEGPDGEVLRAATARFGAAVEFAGVLPHEEVLARMGQSRVVVMPSGSEGVAKVALESLIAGTPVAGYAVGGISDAVKDGVTGVLTAPGDAVGLAAACVALLDGDERWAAMVDAVTVERERIVSRAPTFGEALAEALAPVRDGAW